MLVFSVVTKIYVMILMMLIILKNCNNYDIKMNVENAHYNDTYDDGNDECDGI